MGHFSKDVIASEAKQSDEVVARSDSDVVISSFQRSARLPRDGVYTERSECVPRNDKSGFTLLETIIACGIMVVAFAMLAVIFGKAYDITGSIKRGSKNERWGAYLMNTILYGPGKTATEGLIAATRVYSSTDIATFFPNCIDSSRCLSFYTPNGAIIYELASTAHSLYRNTIAYLANPPYNYSPSTHVNCFDLKPTYAKEGKMELCDSSGFYFYKEDNTQAANTSEIKRVGIKLVIKNALQNLNNAIILYQNVRIRNLYSLE